MVSALFLTWFFAAFLWTVNSLRSPVAPGKGIPPPWLPAMIVSELAPWLLFVRAVIAWGFIALGALDSVIGMIGLSFFVLSEIGLILLISRTIRSVRDMGNPVPVRSLFRVWDSLPSDVAKVTELHYWNGLTLDLYHGNSAEEQPALIYVHPGSWMRGRPGRQARPMFHRLATDGWVVLDIRYPLSPDATFPEHLIGVKRAIAWAKSEGRAYGIDPARVAISGGSSGAHLAALASLTSDHSELQPGFEDVDTSVVACVPFYGIYDLFVRNPTRYDWPFIARYVLKADRKEAPDLYRLGSPLDQVRPDAPPFLVVHGEVDSVVLCDESRHFVTAMRHVGAEVDYLEVSGAQHGFDAIASLRARAVGHAAAQWLARQASRDSSSTLALGNE